MINVTTKPIHIDLELKKKIEFVCNFCNTTPTIINGNIRNIERTNLSYIEPHRIIIKGITFLAFNYSKTLYVSNLSNKYDEIVTELYHENIIDDNDLNIIQNENKNNEKTDDDLEI